jgi:signal transduction histidine kinase
MYKHEGVAISIDTSSDSVIKADRVKLIKVLKSIFRNAKEAMPGGGKLEIKLGKKDTSAVIEISDTGKGIPSLLKDKVFEPFCTYGKENAAGLGLTVARSIIEEHGGTISFSSMLGKGTVFSIHLPLAKKEA